MLIAVLVAGIIFYESFVALKTLASVNAIRATLDGSFAVVRSAAMSDDEKAAAMQKSSVVMMASVGLTAAKIAAAGAIAAAFLFVVSMFAWPFEMLLAYSVTPLALLATVVVLTLYGFLRHGRRKK